MAFVAELVVDSGFVGPDAGFAVGEDVCDLLEREHVQEDQHAQPDLFFVQRARGDQLVGEEEEMLALASHSHKDRDNQQHATYV